MKGRIEHYNPHRGFGFVMGESSSTKIFFHVSQVVSGVPAVGREAIFEMGKTSKGLVAIQVQVLMPSVVAGFTAAAENGGKAGL